MSRSPWTALVTGGTGFIGSHLVRVLAKRRITTTVLVRGSSDVSIVAALEALPGVQVARHDGDTEALLRLFGAARPDVVFHLAARFIAEHRPADVLPLISDNVALSAQLYEAASHVAVRAVIGTGTAWQTGSATGQANTLYAATKSAAEALLAYHAAATPFAAVTLRLFDTYGPDDRRGKLLAALSRAAAGERLAMSAGDQRIDLVHSDDVTRAYVMAAERALSASPGGHEVFGVSSGRALTLREVAAIYARAAGASLALDWGARPYRKGEVMEPPALPTLPGWRAERTLEDGIHDVLR